MGWQRLPKGKKGDEIHLYGRIVALADVYDALRHKRCYKEAWSQEDAQKEITAQKGKHFDPKLVDVFNRCINELELILQRFPD